MTVRGVRCLRWLSGCVWVVVVGSFVVANADERPLRGDVEQFPQSAKIARDRRADVVLESARLLIQQRDFAAAIAQLQPLLDGRDSFVAGSATSRTLSAEAQRLLASMPADGRAAYERLHGQEAQQLRQDALRSSNQGRLRTVVTRFGMTLAGWQALRDLADWHVDRGEWQLAVTAFERLSEHPQSQVTADVRWVARWILVSDTRQARELLDRHRLRLEKTAAPESSKSPHMAAWLDDQLRARIPPEVQPKMATQDELASAPSTATSWRFEVELDAMSAELFQKITDVWRDEDVLPLPSSQLLSVGNLLLARFVHPSKVIAFDATQRKLLWERSTVSALNSAASDLQRHPIMRLPLIEELQQRWFGDSVRGRMSSDGRQLFLITDVEDLDLKPGAGARLRNHLEAWDVTSGERIWRVGSSTHDSPTGLDGQYFLGAPLVSDRILYVVAQRESRVSLLALRADDGQLIWSIPLAETDRQQFRESHWRHVACRVSWSSGQLICPTGAGCVVAVDPVTRTSKWCLRFERDDIPTAIGFGAGDRERPFAQRWWESWREWECHAIQTSGRESKGSNNGQGIAFAERLMLIASPESRVLWGLQTSSGELRWKARFQEPLFVATRTSTDAAHVLVFERHEVTALAPATGTVLWRSRIPNPVGVGDWIGDSYVCPTRGGWVMIDARQGTTRSSESPFSWPENDAAKRSPARTTALSNGRLTRLGNRWGMLTPISLGVFDPLGPNPIAVESARRQLETRPTDHAKLAAELLSQSRDIEELIATRLFLVDAARRAGDLEVALSGLLDLLAMNLTGDASVVDQVAVNASNASSAAHRLAARTVRRDRWLQGQVADLLALANAEDQLKLNNVLSERRQQSFESQDVFALQSLADQLSCLPLGRDLRLSLSGRTGVGIGYLKTSLSLREIAFGSDRIAAAEAWHRLALLHDFRSEPLDAADCYRRLKEEFSDIKRPVEMGTSEWLSDVMPDSAIGRILGKEPADSWPTREPIVTRIEEKHDDIYCPLIPIETRDPFWRRMTVSVERQGRKVRFHGAGQRGYWETTLPASTGIFRHAYNMFRGWGIGPILVLQVGTELFGIQPLDDRGEPNAKVLWSKMVNDADEVVGNELRLGRLGISSDDLMPLDRSEQPLLEVVHVSPGLLCYRTRRRLIAADPATGSRLWMRQELPPRVTVTSDGEFVVVRKTEPQITEICRAFDGRLLASRLDVISSSDILFEQGRFRLSLSDQAKVSGLPAETGLKSQLVCNDLITGQSVWSRELPAKTAPLRIDESRIGILEPSGVLKFLLLSDGHELIQHDVSMPKSLSQLFAFGDSLRLFVLIAGPVTERSWLATEQDRVFRKPLANGWLHAFDRRTLAKLWTIPTGNVPISLDQPNDIPFLMLSYRRPSDDSADGQSTDGVLHAIDKRTGKELLFETGGITNVYFALDPNPQELRIDVLTKSHRIQLDFGEPAR